MTSISETDDIARKQKSIARGYRLRGYTVIENPPAGALPDFIADARPDLLARREGDNVVIEIKRGGSLKGANDLVDLADRVAGHKDWRFELVVVDETEPAVSLAKVERLVHGARRAVKLGLPDVALATIASALVALGQALAAIHGLRTSDISDSALFDRLAFEGVISGAQADEVRRILDERNDLVHAHQAGSEPASETIGMAIDVFQELARTTAGEAA